jgi:hypothetical protein
MIDARNAAAPMHRHRLPEAVSLAQTAARLAPSSAFVNAELGRIPIAAGRVQEGQQLNANALRLAPTDHPEFQKDPIAVLEGSCKGNVDFVQRPIRLDGRYFIAPGQTRGLPRNRSPYASA